MYLYRFYALLALDMRRASRWDECMTCFDKKNMLSLILLYWAAERTLVYQGCSCSVLLLRMLFLVTGITNSVSLLLYTALQIKPTDPKYANRRWSKVDYDQLHNALNQLHPYAQRLQAVVGIIKPPLLFCETQVLYEC